MSLAVLAGPHEITAGIFCCGISVMFIKNHVYTQIMCFKLDQKMKGFFSLVDFVSPQKESLAQVSLLKIN